MKTRTIHNSVKKWADRAINGAKPIVLWVRIGGKKNRKIVERAEKQQRDHFKHKAYKKPRNQERKQRAGTVQYTPPRDKHLCVVLYP